MIRWVSVPVGASTMRIYLAVPDRPGRHPGVIVAQHAGGVDAPIQDTVHRLYREGYVVAAPELFHRQPPGMDPLKRTAALVDSEVIADLNATVAHLKGLRMAVDPIGIVGYCMGGRVSYLAATAIPEIRAAVVFYGGNIMQARGDEPSPFARSAGIQCPILGCFGAEDTNPSPADVQKIDDELTRLGKWHEFHMYRNAGHAFHNFAGERYRERAARASWGEMLAFLTHELKRGGA